MITLQTTWIDRVSDWIYEEFRVNPRDVDILEDNKGFYATWMDLEENYYKEYLPSELQPL